MNDPVDVDVRRAAIRPPGVIPVPATTLVGRRALRTAVRRALESSSFVTLIGPGGIGKSRLAIAVSDEIGAAFPDGAWFIDLTAIPADLSLDEYALGIVTGRRHGAADARGALIDFLAARRALLIFDNCESALDAASRVITGILAGAPQVRVLATSREAFDSLRERVIEVPPLSVPGVGTDTDLAAASRAESTLLFLERFASVQPGFRLDDDNWRTVAEVCRRLEGNPLAIELVAPRLRSLTLARLVDGLEDRLSLSSNDRAIAPRHKSIRDMIAWSWATCTPSEQAVWRRCAAFSGGFDLESADAVCAAEDLPRDSVWQVLDHLVAKSLVVAVADGTTMRFRQLETIAEFGREQLAAAGEAEAAATRHFDAFAGLARDALVSWSTGDQEEIVAMLRRERSNLARALGWGLERPEHRAAACRLAVDLRLHWGADGYLGDGRRRLGRVLEFDGIDPATRCDALWVIAWLEILHGDLDAAEAHLAEAERADGDDDEDPDPSRRAHIAVMRGTVRLWLGEPARAAEYLQGALELLAPLDHAMPGDHFARMLAVLAFAEPDDQERLDAMVHEWDAREHTDADPWGASQVEWAFAYAHWRFGDLDESQRRFERAFASACGFDRVGTALKADTRSWLALSRREATRASRLHGAAAAIWSNLDTSIAAFGTALGEHDRAADAELRELLPDQRRRALLAEGAALDADGLARLALGDDLPDTGDADPLTPRERDITALLGAGLSNREIAARLVLSPRTVEGHISRMLAKLGLASRGQVIAWALQRRQAPDHYPTRDDELGG